jgi:acyl carrier protein
MTQIINQNALKEILGLDDDYAPFDKSLDLNEFVWDSMAMVMLQTYIDTEFNVQIDPDDLPEFTTIGSIDDFIESFK